MAMGTELNSVSGTSPQTRPMGVLSAASPGGVPKEDLARVTRSTRRTRANTQAGKGEAPGWKPGTLGRCAGAKFKGQVNITS